MDNLFLINILIYKDRRMKVLAYNIVGILCCLFQATIILPPKSRI